MLIYISTVTLLILLILFFAALINRVCNLFSKFALWSLRVMKHSVSFLMSVRSATFNFNYDFYFLSFSCKILWWNCFLIGYIYLYLSCTCLIFCQFKIDGPWHPLTKNYILGLVLKLESAKEKFWDINSYQKQARHNNY